MNNKIYHIALLLVIIINAMWFGAFIHILTPLYGYGLLLIVIVLISYLSRDIKVNSIYEYFKSINRFEKFLWFVVAIFFITSFIRTFAPVIGTDTLTARLNNPKRYIQNNGFIDLPFSLAANMSMGAEMIYMFALLIGTQYLPAIFACIINIFLFFIIYVFGKRYFSHRIGLLASTMILATLDFYSSSFLPMQDMLAALFALLSLKTVMDYDITSDKNYLYLLGIFSSSAVAVKLNSVVFISLVFLYLFFLLYKKKQNLLLYIIPILISLLIYLPWFIKAYTYTGNPFYPSLNNLFNLKYPYNILYINETITTGLNFNIKNFFFYPLKISLDPFSGEFLGPFFIISLCFAFYYKFWQEKKLLLFTIMAIFVYTIHYMVLGGFMPIPRYIFISIVLVAYTGCWGISQITDKKNIFYVNVILIIWFSIFSSYSIYKKVKSFPVIFGLQDKSTYQYNISGGFKCYTDFDYMNKNIPFKSKILLFDPRVFYLDAQPVFAQPFGLLLENQRLLSPENVYQILKKENIGYVYLNNDKSNLYNNISTPIYKPIIDLIITNCFIPIYSNHSTNSVLYKLK